VKSRLSDVVFLGIVVLLLVLLIIGLNRMFYHEQRETP
jgi:hypothetical protein